MSGFELKCAYVALVDAAPLIIAKEMGFAETEGFNLTLRRENSWSAVRDKLAVGEVDAAHMLAPAALAMSMGLGGVSEPLDVLMMLSLNGEVIGASKKLSEKLRASGPPLDIMDAASVGARLLAAAPDFLRIGVPFPFSMHLELLDYFLDGIGHPANHRTFITVPPPFMDSAVSSDEIDLFCVGEPWGSRAVESGAAEIILAGAAIWRSAPEKALAVRSSWAVAQPDAVRRLMRATWRAAQWLAEPANTVIAADILARAEYLAVLPELIERSLSGRLVVARGGEEIFTPSFMAFFDRAATFPWRSQALWIADRLSQRHGIDRNAARAIARRTFRADLYRQNLASVGADMPGASEKLEGSLTARTPVATSQGRTFLGPDNFFDGKVFDFPT